MSRRRPRLRRKRKRKKPKTRRNQPTIDLKAELQRICGVDLTSIGRDRRYYGTDDPFRGRHRYEWIPTENHFASWLGLTPSKDMSGGKVSGTGKRKVQNRVAMAFRMAATTLLNSKTYLGSRYRHLRKQLPSHAAAIKAMARYLAVLVYRLLTHGKLGWTEAQPSTSNDAASGNWRA